MSHLLGTFSRQVCKKTSQMSEISFFYDSYVDQLFESRMIKSEFFFNDVYAGWLFVSHCAIDLYNGPFVAIFIFPPNMSPGSPKNKRNVRF